MTSRNKKISVFIVDDSAVVRQTLEAIVSEDPCLTVAGVAADPLIAVEKLRQVVPDVIILDVEMPRMDGLTFLRKVMEQHPVPVVICSSLAEQGSDVVFRAMEYGAVEIIQKPKLVTRRFLEESKIRLTDAVKAAAAARSDLSTRIGKTMAREQRKVGEFQVPVIPAVFRTTEKVVVVGASTGGTEAIRIFLEALPPDSPGIVIVQHMPEHFTQSFARRLDRLCRISVKEAEDNDSVIPGRALIAPGNRHTLLKRSGTRYFVQVKDGPLVSRHRPSVDVLFRSAARYAGKNVIGIIMTGMGSDGTRGMVELHEAGASTIAQDEATSVIFGMPAEAIKAGAIDRILPLERIGLEMIQLCQQ
jgi:two-component system, chemotaxis family, protein-glutamate methylesterase/glutaminase